MCRLELCKDTRWFSRDQEFDMRRACDCSTSYTKSIYYHISSFPKLSKRVSGNKLLLSFTGGDTGIAISKKSGMIPLQMEFGGKDACTVLEDADLDLVAASIIKGGFSCS